MSRYLRMPSSGRAPRPAVLPSFLFLLLALVPSRLSAQQSTCADCHFANPQSDPAPSHLFDWETSAHGRNGVGCEKCHGGDASTFESFVAHRGILASRNPASPTHRANLPRTCGGCHIGPFVAFQKSRHFELLNEGRGAGPTCSSCHGPVAARLLSPRGLQKQCASCHGPEGSSPQSDFPLHGLILHEEVMAIREMLDSISDLIGRVDAPERREELEAAFEQAQVPLTEAVQSAHAFVFDQMVERLQAARSRSEALLEELANPPDLE